MCSSTRRTTERTGEHGESGRYLRELAARAERGEAVPPSFDYLKAEFPEEGARISAGQDRLRHAREQHIERLVSMFSDVPGSRLYIERTLLRTADVEGTAAQLESLYGNEMIRLGLGLPQNRARSSLYADVASMLSGDSQRRRPDVGVRTDGEAFLYSAAVNTLIGDPESGKTLIAAALAADTLFDGGSVLWIDADYNGAATPQRLREFGVPENVLLDSTRFRLVVPEDKEHVLAAVGDAMLYKPTLAVVDSMGEIAGLFEVDSDKDAQFTPMHRATCAALARSGAAVLAIDHLAKGQGFREYGASGTVAKKRATDGLLARVTNKRRFVPGEGGKASINIVKDRFGAVREISERVQGRDEPEVSMFEMYVRDSAVNWRFHTPSAVRVKSNLSDAEQVARLEPIARSATDLRNRMGWGAERAKRAWDEFAARNEAS